MTATRALFRSTQGTPTTLGSTQGAPEPNLPSQSSPDAGLTAPATTRTPALYYATVGHTRRFPIENSFSYRVYMWLVDLDALPTYHRPYAWVARFEARDHLGDPTRSIKDNVVAYLADNGIDLAGGRVIMLANARVAGYVFNPISVHWCYDRDGALDAILAEVHNTYGERHVYLLRPDTSGRAHADKALYVSPFFDSVGQYVMRFSPPAEELSVTMALLKDGRTPFTATLRGQRRAATPGAVLRAALRFPFMPLLVTALIRYQGIKLWARRLPVVPRPVHKPQKGVQ
ncbi:MAG: DUF1365 domain-containing protein [Actinomycetota bacterium]|nr:DUF1365 domain-containing protein [Actinomycetota bacterium]